MREKGITMIALVVTVVVLIILAGISITNLTGNRGIARKATEAQIVTELFQIQEKLDKTKIQNDSLNVKEGNFSGEISIKESEAIKPLKVNGFPNVALLNLKELGMESNLGKNTETVDLEKTYEKLTQLEDVLMIEKSTEKVYYIGKDIYGVEGKVDENTLKLVEKIDTVNPKISVQPENCEEETSVNISVQILSGEYEIGKENKYEYYISTSATDLLGGGWKEYRNEENLTISKTKTRNYYVFFKKVQDEKGNASIGGKITLIGGEEYHRFGPYRFKEEDGKYQIKYDANGGKGAPAGQEKVEGIEVILSNQIPTRTGYTFIGWATSKTATVAEYAAGGTYAENQTVTLYAIWNINSYTVTYNYTQNGGTETSKTEEIVNYKEAIDLTPTATKSGYSFVGWNTNKDANVGLTSLTMEASDVIVYAIFSKTITGTFYYYNGQSVQIAETIYNNATETTITAPTISDVSQDSLTYTGRGWSTSNAPNADLAIASGATVTLSSDATYYASYIRSISANFYYYNGSTQATTTASANRYMNYTGNYVNSNYTIPSTVSGSKGAANTTYSHVSSSKTGGSITPTTAITNYYAVYKKTVIATKYVYNNSPSTVTGIAYGYCDGTTKNASIALGTTSLSGYTFRGWSTSNVANAGITVANNGTANILNNTVYYASYTYTVTTTYHLNGGTGATPSARTTTAYMNYVGTRIGTTIILPAIPTRTGFVANGWYNATSGGSKIGNAGANYTPTASATLYVQYTAAHWFISNTYYVTLADAVKAAAASGTTIYAYDNHTDNSSVAISKNVTINLNGKTVTRGSVITVNAGYTTTFSGSGTLTGSTRKVMNNGNLLIAGPTMITTGTQSTIGANSSGYTRMTSGTIKNTGTGHGISTTANTTGMVDISGGTIAIAGADAAGIMHPGNGTVNVNCNISAGSNCIAEAGSSSATINIAGGNYVTWGKHTTIHFSEQSTGRLSMTGGNIMQYSNYELTCIHLENNNATITKGRIASNKGTGIHKVGTGTVVIGDKSTTYGSTIRIYGYVNSLSYDIAGTATLNNGGLFSNSKTVNNSKVTVKTGRSGYKVNTYAGNTYDFGKVTIKNYINNTEYTISAPKCYKTNLVAQ